MNNNEEVQYTTEYFKEKHNITVTGFDISYVTFQGSKTKTCPAHAAATMLNCYYGENKFVYESFWDSDDPKSGSFKISGDGNNTEHEHDDAIDTIASDTKASKNEYLDQIKIYLDLGVPVELQIYDNVAHSGHFVAAIGYDELDENGRIVFEKLVITDSGTNQADKVVCNMGASHNGNGYTMDNYRLIVPNLLDSTGEYVLDENEKRTTDIYYIDPYKYSDGNIVSRDGARIIDDMISLINDAKLSEEEKEKLKEQVIKVFTGEKAVYENLTVFKNGEYEPDEGVTAYDKVTVSIPIAALGVSENGTYYAGEREVEGFDPVIVNVPDRSDEVEMYRDLWLKEIGEGDEIDTDIPIPGNPDDPDSPGGGNYVFDNAVDVGGDVDLEKYYPAFKAAGRADIAEITGGLGMHFETVYTSDRTDILFTLTNMKNGKSVSMNSSFFTYLDIKNDGWRLASLYVTGWYTGLFLVSGGVTYNMNLYYKDIDFTPPPNWEPHYILT